MHPIFLFGSLVFASLITVYDVLTFNVTIFDLHKNKLIRKNANKLEKQSIKELI